jgi:hypothetical protein
MITKKCRRKIRSAYYPDMKPHIFDKLVGMLPYVLYGLAMPRHYRKLSEMEGK